MKHYLRADRYHDKDMPGITQNENSEVSLEWITIASGVALECAIYLSSYQNEILVFDEEE